MEILDVKNLSFRYAMNDDYSVNNVSFTVNHGDFITICGANGSGKSTLLRMMKRELTPNGEKSGQILFKNIPLENLSDMQSTCSIGFVMQNPEQQIVTDKVWHELAFGLENMNIPKSEASKRIAEMVCYFGIENWYENDVSELSGGQKQLLNLAAVMVMKPDILILDEPTSQLDPIAASDFISALKKLNTELSLTIIIAEHMLEELIPISDKLMIMENGSLTEYDSPENIIPKIVNRPELINCMPAPAKLCSMLSYKRKYPLTIKDGRRFIYDNYSCRIKLTQHEKYTHSDKTALEFKNVFFRYERNSPDILRNFNLTVYENEIFFILGGNGSGKSTALCTASAIYKIYSGYIKVFGKKLKEYKNQSLYKNCLAMLPQNVQNMFLKNTVLEELDSDMDFINSLPYDISHLLHKHPYDISGGEQQLIALAKVLKLNPSILLLDEASKGLDANSKIKLADIIKKLKQSGITIIAVSHDTEFAALCADRCGLLFHGEIVSCNTPDKFFSENTFYTTSASRMTRDYYDYAVTLDDVAELCRINGLKEDLK